MPFFSEINIVKKCKYEVVWRESMKVNMDLKVFASTSTYLPVLLTLLKMVSLSQGRIETKSMT